MDELVRRRDDVLWRRSLDAVLLLPTTRREPVTLTGTGPEVWELLAHPASVADLVRDLAHGYATDSRTVEGDLVELLERLSALGALETVR
jgi:hypothetical protein